MAERAMGAAEHLAAQSPGPERLAQFIGREQATARGRVSAVARQGRPGRPVACLERAGKRAHRLVAILRRLRERASEDDVNPFRKVLAQLGRTWEPFDDHRVHELRGIGFVERGPASQELVGHDRKAVAVGLRSTSPPMLLGRGVCERADELVRTGESRGLRRLVKDQTEIHELVGARAAAEVVRDDVGGLQVAMEDPLIVRELQRPAEGSDDPLDFVERQRAARGDLLPETEAVEQLHGKDGFCSSTL